MISRYAIANKMSVGEKIKQNKKKSREFIHQLYYKNRINFIAAIILTIAMSSLNLMISWLIQQIMDSMANQNMQSVVRCAWLAISGKGVTAGVVIVFVQLMNYILNPISQVPLLWSNRKAAIALMEKLSDALSENVREEGREKLNGFSEKIEVKDLTYGYEPESHMLKDLDVQFDAGKSYAIVGGSGSGKSTLLNLLMGSSSNYQGKICIDGVSIKNIESESLYQLMTSVQQNVFVFNDTIRNNVTMFHEFSDKEVTLALERSGLSEFIEKRGEDFVCGENGANLSGGERRRISIARALLRKSPILLVDEATAALDAATARAVSFSILNLVGMTRIVVTHRLEEAILRRYDKILVMKNGTICEQGNFDTLMQQKGQFYSLFQIAH